MNQFINESIYGFIHLWPAYSTFVFVTDHIPILECCLMSQIHLKHIVCHFIQKTLPMYECRRCFLPFFLLHSQNEVVHNHLVVLLLCIESVFQLEFVVNSVVLPSFCCVPIKIQISIIYEHATPHMWMSRVTCTRIFSGASFFLLCLNQNERKVCLYMNASFRKD